MSVQEKKSITPLASEGRCGGVYDLLKRPLYDLRVSVIDRCNFRCNYCMPQEQNSGQYSFLNSDDWLSFDEITCLVSLFAQLGVSKIRFTGGEPLLRPRIWELIAKIRNVKGIKDMALTTNGSLLPQYAQKLKEAGLNRITISLDTLDEDLFRKMSGQKGELQDVLQGIEAAEEAGFDCIKVNVVLQRGVNDHQVLDLVRYFKGKKPILRFIEYMDVGNCNRWDYKQIVPSAEVVKQINAYSPIKPVKSNYYGEVASRYQFLDGSGEVGFIPSVTQPFCGSCTRGRLTTNGKLYNCLFASEGVDLRDSLRAKMPQENLLEIIRDVWENRDEQYSQLRSEIYSFQKASPKVEMFQIGG